MKHSVAKNSQISLVVLVLLLIAPALTAPLSNAPIVGIDFGSSVTRVGIFRNNSFEIIPNDRRSMATPSFVAWDESGKVLVGEEAKDRLWSHPENTLYDFKWLIGRSYHEAAAEAERRGLPFEILNREGKPSIRVTTNGEAHEHTPEGITALLLAKIKQDAQHYLGDDVNQIVITVPASFNDAQRQAIREASELVGMTALRVINEPAAAIISSGVDKKARGEMYVLVIDLGGGSFDVTLLAIDSGVFEVLYTSSSGINGDDINTRIMNYVLDKWETEHGLNLRGDCTVMQKLWTQIERAKRHLSAQQNLSISVNAVSLGLALREELPQQTVEQFIATQTHDLLACISQVLKESELNADEVNEVILIGGYSQAPSIRRPITLFFNGKEPLESTIVHAEKAVVSGAAFQASIASSDQMDANDMFITEVNVLSLGVETAGGLVEKIVHRNTIVPTRHSKLLTTFCDNQTDVSIRIFEGERAMAKSNRFLGSLKLIGLNPLPKGEPRIKLTFEIPSGLEVLLVSAVDTATGAKVEGTLPLGGYARDWREIERLLQEAEAQADEDVRLRSSIGEFLQQIAAAEKAAFKSEPIFAGSKKVLEEYADGVVAIPEDPVSSHDEL